MLRQIRPGIYVTFKAKTQGLANDTTIIIETPDGQIRLPVTMIVDVDVQEVCEGSPVTSVLANRKGLLGLVKCIDGDEAWVEWQDKQKRTEKLNSLRLYAMQPI